jgi:CTP:molybdopterin cytidylyltransferase MocA
VNVSPTPARVLVVPAAGRGSRLGSPLPKALVPVGGRPMLAWLLDLYSRWTVATVVVAHPTACDAMRALVDAAGTPAAVVTQDEPTGMLDAVRIGCDAARTWSPDRVWITWCDQIAVRPATLERLAGIEAGTDLALPVVVRDAPYIHFDRDAASRIVGVRQRREGQPMPVRGESDMGVFSLSADAAFARLTVFAQTARPDGSTGERNFLPFIPWLASTSPVATIEATDPIEAIGINTPAELADVEAWLASR